MADEKSIFQKIGDAVVNFAPGIATILTATGVGAPIGAAVAAVGSLGRAFGLGDSAKPEDVLQAISADPEIRLKAMVAENDFKAKMAQLELDETKAYLGDVQSARNRQMEVEKVTGRRDTNLYVLAWTIIGGYFGLMGMLLYYSYQGKPITDQTGVLFMLFGTLSTSFGMVVGYFFGSSKGSADKSMELSKTAKELARKV